MARKPPAVSLRKPPAPVPLAAAESFVSGRSGVQASKRSSVSPSKSAGRGIVARADGRELRRMTLYLPADLAKRLAVYCAEHDADLSEVVTEAVAKRLDA